MLNEINILGIKKKVVVAHFDKSAIAVMEPINERTEKDIAQLKKYNTGKEFIERDKIFIYGEVDLDNDEDCKLIKKLFPMSGDIMGNQVYANLDYKTGVVIPIDGNIRWTVEVDPIKWFKYNYCLIGRPKHIIVYKTTLSYL